MLRVDPEKMEAALSDMIEALRPHAEGSKPNNVLSRMQMQVIPAIVRWKASEMSLGTKENDVLNAFVALVSSQMVSVVGEVIGDAEIEEAHFTLANRLMMAIGEEIGSIMTGGRKMQQFNVVAEHAH